MKKQNKRKGFALLEMLGVIAIIAVLVAIVIPVVSNNTVRAAAAANAANLRSIETKVAMHMLMNEDAYEEYLKNSATINAASNNTILSKIYNFFAGPNAAENFAMRYERVYDGGNGTIPVPGDEPITGVPKAQDLEAPNRDGETVMTVSNQYMSVYITEEGAIAFYGDWTKEDFADVAEDGIYDGTTTGTGGNGNTNFIEQAVCISTKKHAPGPGCVCQTCGGAAHWGADAPSYTTSETKHLCESNHIIQEHQYVEVDADYHRCELCGENAEKIKHFWDDYDCTHCGYTKPVCSITGCTNLKVNNTEYCTKHKLVDCDYKLKDGSECTGQYNDNTFDVCPNSWDHAPTGSCPVCKTEGLLFNGKCWDHRNWKKCECGTYYGGDACANTDYHGHECTYSGHNCTYPGGCENKTSCNDYFGYCSICYAHKDNCANCGTAHTCSHTSGWSKKCTTCNNAKIGCPAC